MSLAAQRLPEYDDEAYRKLLSKAIKRHQAKAAELAEAQAAITKAQNRLTGLTVTPRRSPGFAVRPGFEAMARSL
jgi:hypothetical protein